MSPRRATPSQTVGPFFGFALPFEHGSEASAPRSRRTLRLEGRVLDGGGAPVPDALLEVWADDQIARARTDARGEFRFWIRKPPATRVGRRSGAPHLEVTLFARGLLRHLATRVYFPDEASANSADPVLRRVPPARRQTLVARRDGARLVFDVRLQGENETVFFAI
jgi:protocatechuate 3,4-dioxygenase alpha subunit